MKLGLREIFLVSAVLASSVASATDQYIRAYLKQVYPTSVEMMKRSDTELRDYYALKLNTWYRTPVTGFESGLLDQRIEPQYKVFVFPDTAARSRTDLNNAQQEAKQGFRTEKAILGSNKDYIEVSSLAWMSFPFGAYFNWAHGSGIYLYTGGKSIIGYTKVDVLYNIYHSRNKTNDYYRQLGNTRMVQRQIFGSDQPINEALQLYVSVTSPNEYEQKTGSRQFTQDKFNLAGGAYPLAAALLAERTWKDDGFLKIKKNLDRGRYKDAYRILVKKYVEDHRLGQFNQELERYKYLAGEAMPDIDEWMYDEAKADGYTVIQMTFEPNSMGQPTFEICDLRWPKLGGIPNIEVDAIDKGTQNYSISYSWKKAEKWLSKRDPFDLMSDAKSMPVRIVLPSLDDRPNPSLIQPPPAGFPKDWLPEGGWNVSAANGDYHKTDTFPEWIKLQPAPAGLALPDGKGRFVSWALDNTDDFSFINVEKNKQILIKAANVSE